MLYQILSVRIIRNSETSRKEWRNTLHYSTVTFRVAMPRVSPQNKLLSQSCSCYHMSRKLPGKFRETSLSQPFFPAKKGRYAWKIGVQYPRGDSSYHARPRSAYQELRRASARVQNTMSHLEERAQRAHYRTCYAWHARTCADRRARRVFWYFHEIFINFSMENLRM